MAMAVLKIKFKEDSIGDGGGGEEKVTFGEWKSTW